MSSLALPPLARPQASLDHRAHWITPEEQLNRLNRSYLPIEEEITRLTPLIREVAKLVVQYVVDEWVTNWYTAQTRLNSLPQTIPPLPEDIYQIMDCECPIYAGQLKADKTAYKIRDTHFLSLVPKEFDNVNRLKRDVLQPYGKRTYAQEENPLQFRYFLPETYNEYADIPFPDTHWILMTKNVLPGSRKKSWDQQVALVDALRQKALMDYEIPTLQQSFAGITTDMVATGERHYQAYYGPNRYVYTYTRVKEMTPGNHLTIGGFDPGGLSLLFTNDREGDGTVGIAVLRKF